MNEDIAARRLEREKSARLEAERLLEIKSLDLYLSNQSLKDLANNLESQVKERTKELALARDEALADSESKSRFMAIISHEVRSPLNGIIGALSLLNDTQLSPEQRKFTSAARSSSTSILSIVNNILDYTKIKLGEMKIDHVEFDLYQLLDSVSRISQVSIKASKKSLLLETKISSKIPRFILGDEERMRQIIVNIVDNALKFTYEGKITITMDIDNTPDGNSWLLFGVQDTGVGISEESQTKLLEEYWSDSGEMSGNVMSTGLGLAISNRLVQLMNGELGYESILGSGSFFWFKIPLNPARTNIVTQIDNESVIPANTQNILEGHILLAEDNSVNQFIVSTILRKMGLSVETASNGKEALEFVVNRHFDAILMDIDMPEMDGVSATKHIRALPDQNRARIPIIAVTAHAMPGDQENLLSAGLDSYLVKPVTKESLFTCLSKWISIKPSAQQPGLHTPKGEIGEIAQIDHAVFKRLISEIGAENMSGLAEMFISELGLIVDEIEAAIETDNYRIIANKGHALKGSSVSFGAYGLSRIAGEIEEHAMHKDMENVDISTQKLLQVRKKVEANLLSALETLNL